MKRKEEQAELDALLKSESQQMVQRAVRALPEDSLSLAWRSDLNERLRQVRPVSKWRSRVVIAWRPALGLALATCLAVMVTVKTTPPSPQHTGNLEASLVTAYDDSTTADELVGPGLAVHEVNDTTRTQQTSSEWSESDLNNL
jgi:hypothetical protein